MLHADRLLLLPLVMSGFVASAVGQTNPNHLAREQSRYLNRTMKQPVHWYPWSADAICGVEVGVRVAVHAFLLPAAAPRQRLEELVALTRR